MDEAENGNFGKTPDPADSAAEAARGAAEYLREDAEKTLKNIRSRGIRGFLGFQYMYFPIIANYVFIVIVLFSIAGIALGVIGGFLAIFTTGVLAGLGMMLAAVIGGVVGIIFTRIFFETILLGFKINEGIQEIRDRSCK